MFSMTVFRFWAVASQRYAIDGQHSNEAPSAQFAIATSTNFVLDCDSGCFRAQDRKSTRLNSSHHSISYAVFCLKKKKFIYLHSPTHRDHTDLTRLLLTPIAND